MWVDVVFSAGSGLEKYERMRILVDYTSAIAQGAGIGRYTRSLMNALLRVDHGDRFTLFSAERPTAERTFPSAPNARAVIGHLDNRRMTILWHRLRAPLPIEALAGRADVLHAPDFSLPPTIGARKVVTIHDLAFMTHPECAVPALRGYLNRVVPHAVSRADHIIAVSQRTADDLVELLGVAPKKISVIHLGVDPAVRRVGDAATLSAAEARYDLQRPFALAVGTIEPRKNYARLIEAFARARGRQGGPTQLVMMGRKGWLYDDVFDAVERLGLRDAVRFLDYIPDGDLATLYSLASVVAMPSLYEGFGIPVVEAMACGTPVIASSGGSLPEIVGDAGVLVAADDTEGLAEALVRTVSDDALRTDLVARGYERVRAFDWDVAARRHVEVYHAVAKG
ncbi:MAG TPA: glycosyltransferase family 1 protein [Ktedonobacterales bacterium]|nr:glycosyltransferase family 1 protein [Ktedonobacterales bacterium]